MLKLRTTTPARTVLALSLLAVTCCQTPQPAPPAAPPVATNVRTQAPVPPEVRASVPLPIPAQTAWEDRPQTPGDWKYMRDQDGASRAMFVRSGQVMFGMSCKPSRRIRLVVPDATATQMVVRSETTDRMLTGQREDGALQVELPANDPLLDAMAITRGRFAVEVEGKSALYLPAWAEVTRVIEDCR